MDTRNSVRDILAQMRAVLTHDHFVYTSGKHGPNYVAKDVIYTDPYRTSEVCKNIALRVLRHCEDTLKIDRVTVVSPVAGGVALSQWVTYHLLGFGANVFKAFATFADKEQVAITLSANELVKLSGEWQTIPKGASLLIDTGAFIIKRGYGNLIADRNVVVVEDIINTGKSVRATVDAVVKAGGKVVMVAAICNRGGMTAEKLGVPHLYCGLDVDFEMFDPEDCPLCRAGTPINTEFGHGKAFLEKRGK